MNKIRVLKGALVFAVIGLCGIGIITVFGREGILDKHREETGKAGRDFETAAAPSQSPYSDAQASDTREPVATVSPKPVRGKVLKKHREGKVLWSYNKVTRCLVISGKGKISVNGKDESIGDTDPDFFPWDVWNKQCYRPHYAEKVKKIIIKPGITCINAGAFEGCKQLERVSFSNGSKCSWIGKNAFSGCTRLKEVLLPDSVRYVGYGAFYKCKSLRRVSLGSSFTGFTWADTWEEAEKSHGIPSYSTFVDGFSYGRIKKFKVSRANPWYSSQDGVLYNKDKTMLFCYPQGKKDKTVKIPDSVKVVRGSAFRCNRHIEHVVLSRSLKRIGVGAFEWSPNLKTVKITGDKVVIDRRAFFCCQSLSQVDLGDSVRQIKASAFYDTKLQEIHIPPSVKKIGKEALGKWCDRRKLEGGTTSLTTRDVPGFTIYGKKGSVAERYAEEYVFDFVEE